MRASSSSRAGAYVASVRDALRTRKLIVAPSLARVVIPVATILFAVLVGCVAVAPADDIDFHFREEAGIVTALSAISLAMASGFAALCFRTEGRPGHGLRAWWLLTSLGFLFFACDELLRFHERIGTWVRHVYVRSPFFRNWNDIIVVLYGAIALGVVAYFLPRILRLPLHAELLAVGLVAYAVHTTVDVLPHTEGIIGSLASSIPPAIVEEGAKLFASAFFAVAMFNAVRILTRSPSAPTPADT